MLVSCFYGALMIGDEKITGRESVGLNNVARAAKCPSNSLFGYTDRMPREEFQSTLRPHPASSQDPLNSVPSVASWFAPQNCQSLGLGPGAALPSSPSILQGSHRARGETPHDEGTSRPSTAFTPHPSSARPSRRRTCHLGPLLWTRAESPTGASAGPRKRPSSANHAPQN